MKKFSEMNQQEKQILGQRVQLYGGVAVIFILCALFLQYFNVRQLETDGILPTPRSSIDALSITLVRQDDPAWGEIPLAETGFTMAQEGSLFACLSMLMQTHDIAQTPTQINAEFAAGGLFVDGKMADVTRLNTLYPVQFVAPRTFDGQTMTDLLKNGTPCIVRAKRDGNAYWLCVIGATREDFMVLSPLDKEIGNLADYGNVYAMGYLVDAGGK